MIHPAMRPKQCRRCRRQLLPISWEQSIITPAPRAAADERATARQALPFTAALARQRRPAPRGTRGPRVEADEQRPRDDRMADRHLVEMRQRPEQREVVEVEIVAGVDAEAQRVGELGRPRRSPRNDARAGARGPARTPARTARCRARRGRRRARGQAARPPPSDRRTGSRGCPRLQRATTAGSAVGCGAAAQPAWLVISPGTTGTSVHWSGRTSSTSSSSSGRGIALDVELDLRPDAARAARAISRTSSGVMCRRRPAGAP